MFTEMMPFALAISRMVLRLCFCYYMLYLEVKVTSGLVVFNERVRLGPSKYRLVSSTTLYEFSTGRRAGMPDVVQRGWDSMDWSKRMIRTTLIISL